MKLELFKRAVIKENIPKYKLKKGDLVVPVEFFPARKTRKAGYAVELFNLFGESVGVYDLTESQLEPIPVHAVPSIRKTHKIAV